MASIPNIFEDPRGAELETTAGTVRADAPNSRVARQVEENASLEHQAAEQAASVAKTKGRRLTGEMATSVDKLRNIPGKNVQDPLEKAVEEGKRDVADTLAAGAEKLDQVKETVAKATTSAQEYMMPGGLKGLGPQSQDGMSSGGILPPLQSAASAVTETTMSTLASAKATATSAAQNVLGMAGTQGAQMKDMPASSTGIPATTVPSESRDGK